MGFFGSNKPEHGSTEKLSGSNEISSITDSLSEVELEKQELKKNPFKDPATSEYYTKLYEEANYECRHLFDADLEWTKEEERKLVWKLDFRITALACFMFIALQIDRGNIKQAVSDNMLEDLGLTTDEYNYGNLISRAAFLAGELPSGLVSKAIGADIWLPIQMIAWSVVATSQAALSGKKSFYVTRALIAVLEGGFIPDIVLWLSYFYTSGELTNRLSLFWTSLSFCDIAIALIAFGILRMRDIAGLEGWRWLFLIEGLVSLLISIAAAFLMIPSIAKTKKFWNKSPWFNDREQKIVVNRVLRDDPSKGDMNNRQALSLKRIWKAFIDFDLWPIYIMGLIAFAAYNTVGNYFTLLLKGMGYSTYVTNVLVIPSNVLHIITLTIVSWLSEKYNERSWFCLGTVFWQLPLLGLMCWWPGFYFERWPSFVFITLIMGAPYIHAINVSWLSRNSNSIKSRTISTALYNMCVQAGGMYSANIYQSSDKPLYKEGNKVLFGLMCAYGAVIVATKYYYIFRNKQKETKWNALSKEEQADYILNSPDEGTHRIDFRFVH